jgi:hypothetical protein
LPFDSEAVVDVSVTTMATLASALANAAPLLKMKVEAAVATVVGEADEGEPVLLPVGEEGAGGGAISVVVTAAGGNMAVPEAISSSFLTAGFSSSSSSVRCFLVPAAHGWFCFLERR